MSETLYVRNLNEKLRLDKLKRVLKREFSLFGDVLDIVAHKNIRMRGQAFIIFNDPEQAQKALEALDKVDLVGKPMQIDFSQKPSDITVQKLKPEEFESHKKKRLEAKQQRKENEPEKTKKRRRAKEDKNRTGIAQPPKKQQKKTSTPTSNTSGSTTNITTTTTTGAQAEDATGASSRLPRNKILFLENLPPSITEDTLVQIFSAFPGFSEVRLVAIRRLGFVEYDTEDQAAIARDATMGLVNDGYTVKITYAKK